MHASMHPCTCPSVMVWGGICCTHAPLQHLIPRKSPSFTVQCFCLPRRWSSLNTILPTCGNNFSPHAVEWARKCHWCGVRICPPVGLGLIILRRSILPSIYAWTLACSSIWNLMVRSNCTLNNGKTVKIEQKSENSALCRHKSCRNQPHVGLELLGALLPPSME